MELNKKIINFLGDSITEGEGVNEIAYRYDCIIREQCGLTAANNYGISGTRIAHQMVPSDIPRHDLCFCGRAYEMNKDADIVVVFGGTNDYGHGDAPFGELTDRTPATFCGAVEFLMNLLKALYRDKTIIFMAPARRFGDMQPGVGKARPADAHVLRDYVEVIVKKGAEHNIPVLNLYDNLGINPNNDEDRINYTADGLHLNEAGHKKLAQCLIDFIRKI